jgi:hypothetical protein
MSTQLDQVKQKAGRIARRTLWITLAGLFVASIGYYVYRTYTISEGSRSGTLFKISKKGVVFKTYEGQLHLAGSAMLTNQSTWDFSAKDANVYSELQKYEGKNVKCYYKELVNTFPWQGDTDYLVYRVEQVQ